ncbi:MAG TPA: signal peptidase II [Candidatus Deferrimicrobiaceae bacterium]
MPDPATKFSLTPGKLVVPLLVAIVVTALDQWSKLAVVQAYRLFEGKALVPNFFNVVHVHNTGVAFSMFAGLDPRWSVPLLAGATLLAVAGVIGYLGFLPARGATPSALGLILGGAIGNLIDRVRLGYVIDFLDFYWKRFHWPAFNVADIAISAGVILLALDLLREQRPGGTDSP